MQPDDHSSQNHQASVIADPERIVGLSDHTESEEAVGSDGRAQQATANECREDGRSSV